MLFGRERFTEPVGGIENAYRCLNVPIKLMKKVAHRSGPKKAHFVCIMNILTPAFPFEVSGTVGTQQVRLCAQ